MLLRQNKNVELTFLQSTKMTLVQISEVAMAVASLDDHKILSSDRLIKCLQFIVYF
jgi:hypothetical protein